MNTTQYSNNELKIRKQVIKHLNNNIILVKDIYKPKKINIIGLS